jgi:hypothetical protein
MARFRTLAAGALFLYGTTLFLWFMPSFLGAATQVEGAVWSAIQLLVLATSLGRGLDRRLTGPPRQRT